MEVESVGDSGAEDEVTDGGTSLHLEDRSVVLLEPRPAVRERAVPVEQLCPVAKEDGVGVEVDAAEAVGEDEARHVGEDDRETVILVGRGSDAFEKLVLMLGREGSGDLRGVELTSLVGSELAGRGEGGFGGLNDFAAVVVGELLTLSFSNLVVSNALVAFDVVGGLLNASGGLRDWKRGENRRERRGGRRKVSLGNEGKKVTKKRRTPYFTPPELKSLISRHPFISLTPSSCSVVFQRRNLTTSLKRSWSNGALHGFFERSVRIFVSALGSGNDDAGPGLIQIQS